IQGEIDEKVEELLEKRCIEPSNSAYSSPIVMVKKKTGQWRMCVDFRQINAKSVKDAYPIPRINFILKQLREAKFEGRGGEQLREHMANLKEVFRRLKAANLRINTDKCHFFREELLYLGHRITSQGIGMDPGKVAAITELEPPTNVKGVRQFIGMAYFWPGMQRDVRKYVRKCETCMRYKPSQIQGAGKMLTQVPEEPWATVCADFVGPLPRSKHGNTMLLVIIDRFSK
ncbi:hypothetical protein KR067_013072, partial [Drosophila pandora]